MLHAPVDTASNLTSQRLFTAFLALTDESQMQAFQNPEDHFFYFIEDDITKCLNRHFRDFSFHIEDIPNYNDTKRAVVTPIVSGFGGDRFMKIIDKKVTGDTVVFTAAFYDDMTMNGNAYMEKCYTIQLYENGCYYLSAIERID